MSDTQKSRLASRLFIVATILTPLDCPLVADEGESVLQQVLCDWKKLPGQMKSIRFSSEGTSATFAEHFEDWPEHFNFDLPHITYKFQRQLDVQIDILHNCFRKHLRAPTYHGNRREWIQSDNCRMFDGESSTLVQLQSRDNEQIRVVARLPVSPVFTTQDLPWLHALGIFKTVHREEDGCWKIDLSAENSNRFLRRLKFRKIFDEGSLRCALLEAQPEKRDPDERQEFVVDLDRRSTIVRWCEYRKNRPRLAYKVESQKVDDLWLPKSWTWVWIGDGSPDMCIQMQVNQIRTDLTFQREDYQPVRKPGDILRDLTEQ